MATNHIKKFAGSSLADVLSQSEYEALPDLDTGFPTGLLTRQKINKVLLQSSTMAAAVAEAIVADGADVTDDATPAALAARLRSSILAGSGSASGLAADLASAAAGKGAAIVGYKHPASLAIARNSSAKMSDAISSADMGASGDGIVDDTAKIQALVSSFGASGGTADLLPGVYKITSTITIPTNVTLRGAGKRTSIIIKSFSGIGLMLSDNSRIELLQVNNNSNTGAAVAITSGNYQSVDRCRLHGGPSSAITFSPDTGLESRVMCSEVSTTGSPGVVGAISCTGVDAGGAPRHFSDLAGEGATLFDFGGMNDTFVINCYTGGIITSPSTSKAMLVNCRIGAAAGSVTIRGANNMISNSVFATPITLECTDSVIDVVVPGWNITDNGTGNSVLQRLAQYTPVWSSANSPQPSIGNGSLAGYFSRSGATITVQINLSIGSTTTFGTGAWRFSLPRADLSPYSIVQVVGSGMTQSSGAQDFQLTLRTTGGSGILELFTVNPSGALVQIGSATQSWSPGGSIRLTASYLTS